MINAYNSVVDFKNSYKEGRVSERKFADIAIQKGFNVKKSSNKQDIFDHIDYFLYKDDQAISFDVKAQKRISRSGSINSERVWIELTNVNGNDGWIDGKQDCIAFEFPESYIVVNRLSLREYVYSIINFNLPVVSSSYEAHYRIYQRRGRRDRITTINKEDLLKVKHRIWYK